MAASPYLTLAEQHAIAAALEGVAAAMEQVRKETNLLKCLKESTADALPTRRVRVEGANWLKMNW